MEEEVNSIVAPFLEDFSQYSGELVTGLDYLSMMDRAADSLTVALEMDTLVQPEDVSNNLDRSIFRV